MAESSGNSSNSSSDSTNTRTSTANSNKTTGNSSVGFSSGYDSNDAKAINERISRQNNFSPREVRGRNNIKSKPSDLPKKDELENKDDGLENKKDNNIKKDNSSKKSSPKNLKDSVKKEAIDKLTKKGGIAGKWKKLKFKLIVAGVILGIIGFIFIVAIFGAAYDSLIGSISTFFGIKEEDENYEDLMHDDKYHINPKTGEYYDEDELVDALKDDNNCQATLWTGLKDFLGIQDDPCSLIRYIQKETNKLEKDYNVTLDKALPVSSLFYGYAAQPNYSEYYDRKDIPDTPPAIEHYDSILDMLTVTKVLKKDDIKDMINYSLLDTTHDVYTWEITPEVDRNGVVRRATGTCVKTKQKDYKYSLLYWQIFMRYGKDVAETYRQLLIKRNSYLASDIECNGTDSDGVLLSKIKEATGASEAVLDTGAINTARKALEDGLPQSLELFEQKVEITGYEKDILTPYNWKGYHVDFDYKTGFVYKRFPYYERAYELGVTNSKYDDAITPKIIEHSLSDLIDRKTTFNAILGYTDADNPNAFTSMGSMWSSVKGAYCGDYISAPFNQIQVEIKDCNGSTVGTVGFKEYIMGVAYGEVSDKNDDYVKSEMVAAISYALHRRSNYMSVPNIVMRSGNCDQVFCPMNMGCSSKTSNISCGSRNCVSYLPGGSSYHGAASDALIQKYAKLYDEASQFLLVKDGTVFGASYVSTVQNEWYSKAQAGMSFTQIIQETYASQGAELIQCQSLDSSSTNNSNNSNNSSTSTDTGNGPSTIVKKGNKKTEEYDKVSPDNGKFYGYSYNDKPEGESITINPEWVNENIVSVSTNCSLWNQSFRVNKQAVNNYKQAFSNVCKILKDGVKISDGTICKYTSNDLIFGSTFEQKKTVSGMISDISYGIIQPINRNKSYKINGVSYTPYSKGIENYNEFVSFLEKEEDCNNINYILYKYAYKDAGFTWDKKNPSVFKVGN